MRSGSTKRGPNRCARRARIRVRNEIGVKAVDDYTLQFTTEVHHGTLALGVDLVDEVMRRKPMLGAVLARAEVAVAADSQPA